MPRRYSMQLWFVQLGAGLASMALFVEPQYLSVARNDQPTVELACEKCSVSLKSLDFE